MHPRLISISLPGLLLAVIAGAPAAFAAGPGLHGRVLGLDDEGQYVGIVPGATIEFRGQSGTAAAETTSGENGYYRVDLAPGVYTYRISAEGYRTDDVGRGLEIQQSEGYVVHDFSLVRGENEPAEEPSQAETVPVGELSGRVFEITERKQRLGVPNARIALRAADSTELRRVTAQGGAPESDDAGAYHVQLPVGEWRASVTAEGFETLIDPDPIPITDGEMSTRDFILTRKRPAPESEQGIKGLVEIPAETARPAVRVRIESLLGTAEGVPTLTPDDGGRFVQKLPAGDYRVVAEAEGFHPATRIPVSVFEGRYTGVVLRLAPLAKPEQPIQPETKPEALGLVVTVKERKADGLTPIARARVLLRRDGDALSQATRQETNADGQSDFFIDAEGGFAVLAQAEGFKPGGLKVHIGPGQPNRADIILIREAADTEQQLVTVHGTVVVRDPKAPKVMRALPHTRLTWRDSRLGQPVQIADSDAQGAFSVEVPAGAYVVELQPPAGFEPGKEEVLVKAPMAARTFILAPTVEPDGKPPVEPVRDVQVAGIVVSIPAAQVRRSVAVANATVSWIGPQATKSARTDRSGRFSVALPPGLYQVHVAAAGYAELTESIVVQPGMDQVRLVLNRSAEDAPEQLALNLRVMQRAEPTRGLRGSVMGGMSPLPNAAIVIRQQGQIVAQGRSDQSGHYSAKLKPGLYDVKVTHEGYVPGQVDVAMATAAESRDIVLSRAAAPPDQPPPAGKQTLTLRIVEQPGPAPLPAGTLPDQSQGSRTDTQSPQKSRVGGQQQRSGTERLQGLQLQRDSGASALDLLQQRAQRERNQNPAGFEILKPRIGPVAGATVVIRQGETIVAQGTADRNGIYRVELDPRSYDVKVSHQGYLPTRQSVRVADADVTRQIVLSKARAVP